MTRAVYTWWALVVAIVLLTASGCGSSGADEDPDGDTSGPGQTCTTDADCYEATGNMSCNSTGVCIDHGQCTANDQCVSWYGQTLSFCGDAGVCTATGPTDGDSPDGDEPDGDNPDGDNPDGDDLTCDDFSGLYEGEFNCSGTSYYDVWVAVDYMSCEISLFYNDGADKWIRGQVNGNGISTDDGMSCSGSGTVGQIITLDCGACLITLTPKTSSSDSQISARPTELNFGAVYPGESAYKETTITNNGTGDLTIKALYFTSETSDEFSIDDPQNHWAIPRVIASGNQYELGLTFEPVDEVAEEGMLVLMSDAANQPVTRIRLYSQLKEVPKVELEPTALNFGEAAWGLENKKYFLIKNMGGAGTQIRKIELTNDADGAFYLASFDGENSGVKPPVALEAKTTKSVVVSFSPIQGVHTIDQNLVGRAEVTWVDKNQAEQVEFVDLLGSVVDLKPPCLEISPLAGKVGFAGLGEVPGPGINFGNSNINVPHTETMTIKNCGDLPLNLWGFVWQNPFFNSPPLESGHFVEAPGAFANQTLDRGESMYLDLTFLPSSAGVLYASGFNFYSNAEKYAWAPEGSAPPDSSLFIAAGVQGYGARKGIEVLPSKLDFGLVTLDCCSRREQVNVWNVGNLELSISTIQIGAGSDERFELVGLPSMPVTLGGEGNPQSFSFEVKFCPSKEGPHEGRVEIVNDDDENQIFIVPLQGDGTLVSHTVDTFEQNMYPMVDILWAVDCSGSMSEEQGRLSQNFGWFIDEAVTWNADLHLGVISADIIEASHSGKLQGTPAVMANRESGWDNDRLRDEFEDRIELGTGCDGGQEAGLEAAYMALDEPLILNENAGFLREDAKLSIIFVSDEEDQAEAEVPFYIDFFRSIKGMRNVNMIEVYAIVGDPDGGCTDTTDDQSASAGKRYNAVADACNVHDDAHFMSICETDYRPVYDTLADNLFALKSQFFLSRSADESTIVVTVSGDVDDTWEYDSPSNSIVFPDDDPPPPGAEIVVEYDAECLE